MTQSEITALMAALIEAGRDDQKSGVRGSAEMAWVDRIHSNGFSYEIREHIASFGQMACFGAYSAAWFLYGNKTI